MKRAFKLSTKTGSVVLVYDEETNQVSQHGSVFSPSATYLGYAHCKNAFAKVYTVGEDDETAALEEQLNGKGHEHDEE